MSAEILDAILSGMSGGPRVVSEQHDVGQIAIDTTGLNDAVMRAAGVWFRDGKWDTCEMGISQEEAQRRYDAADTPEKKAEFMKEMRERAVRRASLDTSNGRVNVVVVGEPAWHRLGVNVELALNSKQARQLSGLDWTASKRDLVYSHAGEPVKSRRTWSIVRDDTGAEIGAVGTKYKIIQNAEAFDFLDAVIGEFGAKYHTAGSVDGGEKVWMQCELVRHAFEPAPGDKVMAFATFTNCHDGSGKAWCFPTTDRIVCRNTFCTASRNRHQGLGIRHTGDVKQLVNEARTALGIAIGEIGQFKEAADVMVHTPVVAEAFFSDLLDHILGVSAADALAGSDALAAAVAKTQAQQEIEARRIQRELDHRAYLLSDMIERYNGPKCGVGGIRGSAWAAFNAATEQADHLAPRRKVGTEEQQASRRWESALTGDGDRMKQVAYELLTTPARPRA
jgi:phage/plasmid-like protein (TIGR03299 family)